MIAPISPHRLPHPSSPTWPISPQSSPLLLAGATGTPHWWDVRIVNASTANGSVPSHLQDVPSPAQQIQMHLLPFPLLLVLQVSAHPSKQIHPVPNSFYLLCSLNKRVIHRGIQLYRHWVVLTICCYPVWRCAMLWIGHVLRSFSLPALQSNSMLLRVMV